MALVLDGLAFVSDSLRLMVASTMVENGGVIQADEKGFGMHTSTVTGSLTNSGTITSTIAGSTNVFAIDLYSSDIEGGIINTGTISIGGANTGSSYAIKLDGTAEMTGLLDNSGSIAGGHWGVYVGSGVNWSGSNTGNVAVNNRLGGTIDNGFLISGGTISGQFINAGTINMNKFAGFGAINMSSSGDISGGIINDTGGVFEGSGGIALNNTTANTIAFTNRGTVTGDLQKANVTLEAGSITGDITGSLTFSAAA